MFTVDISELKKTNALTLLSDECREYYNKHAKDTVEHEEVELQCEWNAFTYDRARKQYIGFSRQGLEGKFLRKPMREHYIKDVLECVKGSKHKPGYDGKAYLERVKKIQGDLNLYIHDIQETKVTE